MKWWAMRASASARALLGPMPFALAELAEV
jgi:hypothetical protein